MANKGKGMKKFGRYVWELFKGSILASLMYFCAGAVLMMLTMKEEVVWNGGKVAWTVGCILVAAAYQGLLSWTSGGNAYEMLVSGNVKRSTYDAYGNEYKMSNHKEAKEYRAWKGFAIGAFVALIPVIFGIILGCNQAKIHTDSLGKGLGIAVLTSFLLSGWSIIPLYCINATGGAVSYFLSIAFAIIPVVVSGVMYIVGAYARRNKALRLQMLAEKAEQEEAAKRANRKINYGGLPGTKPKKRK